MLARVKEDPFLPVYWGKNQKGMSADEEIEGDKQRAAEATWLIARDNAVEEVQNLLNIGVHKQIANRLLEPWLFHTIIITASELANFFNLRRDKSAQPEIRKGADLMWRVLDSSVPDDVGYGKWHLPLVKGVDLPQLLDEQYTEMELAQISCGRCARVSYLTHDGVRDPRADVEMVTKRLAPSGHMSPLEHAARPMYLEEKNLFAQAGIKVVNSDGRLVIEADRDNPTYYCGNVQGFVQYRKLIPGEDVFTQMQL
jgi:thymidylate synthase ThyX